jgi:hypothetical protein
VITIKPKGLLSGPPELNLDEIESGYKESSPFHRVRTDSGVSHIYRTMKRGNNPPRLAYVGQQEWGNHIARNYLYGRKTYGYTLLARGKAMRVTKQRNGKKYILQPDTLVTKDCPLWITDNLRTFLMVIYGRGVGTLRTPNLETAVDFKTLGYAPALVLGPAPPYDFIPWMTASFLPPIAGGPHVIDDLDKGEALIDLLKNGEPQRVGWDEYEAAIWQSYQ